MWINQQCPPEFSGPIARNLRPRRPPTPNNYWHFDEKVLVIRGQRYGLDGTRDIHFVAKLSPLSQGFPRSGLTDSCFFDSANIFDVIPQNF